MEKEITKQDSIRCACGNKPGEKAFDLCHELTENGWMDLYICDDCGHTIDAKILKAA